MYVKYLYIHGKRSTDKEMGVKKKHTVSLRFLSLMCTVMSYQHEIRVWSPNLPSKGASDIQVLKVAEHSFGSL